MNYIKHLSGFFDKISADDRLNPTHISLYVSLFQFWNACRFHNPISISRNEVMTVSKICSKATYHKCIRELNDYGYLSYQPSYNPFKGSLVYLFNLKTGTEQVLNMERTKIGTSAEQALNMERTKIGTSTEQALVPYINNTNISKHKTKVNERALTQKKSNSEINFSVQQNTVELKKKKVAPKKKSNSPEPVLSNVEGKGVTVGRGMIIPHLIEVQEYFASQKFPAIEADKLFNHFTSNGWLVSGKTPMKNWQAASNKWMLNNQKFNNTSIIKTPHLHATTGKNYSEAL
jgi:hypothetical protein